MSKLSCVSVLAFSFAAIAAPSYANDVAVSAGSRIVNVSFSDLNVRTDAGAKALLDRIELAAQTVCGPEPKASDADATYSYNNCIMVAVDGAVAQVGDVMFADASTQPGTIATQ